MITRVTSIASLLLLAVPAACSGKTSADTGGRPIADASVGDVSNGGSAGGAGTDAGGGICFAGAKICPQPSTFELVCVEPINPDFGCNSTACDPCAVPNATALCNDTGACAVGSCDAGWADCNGVAGDGCETNLDSDPGHCGDCATDCLSTFGPGFSCESGQCVLNSAGCEWPYLDCDLDKTNGCEIDVTNDVGNCGACGVKCASGATCIQAKCQ